MNADPFKQMTKQLQNLSSTVEALSKSITPQAVSSLSHADAAPRLCLLHIMPPVFMGKENLDRFVEQITSLLQLSGDARAYQAMIEVEKEHQHLLSLTLEKASTDEDKKTLRGVLEHFKNKTH